MTLKQQIKWMMGQDEAMIRINDYVRLSYKRTKDFNWDGSDSITAEFEAHPGKFNSIKVITSRDYDGITKELVEFQKKAFQNLSDGLCNALKGGLIY